MVTFRHSLSQEDVPLEEYDLGSPLASEQEEHGARSKLSAVREVTTEENESTTAYHGAGAADTQPLWLDGHKMWNSIWLQTEILVSFMVLFIALFLITVILYHFSSVNQGLSRASSYREYGWRYGPTALLTVVLSVWMQVDYSTKILTPWKELRRGPATADRSVLLDYISPFSLVVLWRSTRNRHWAVTLTIIGSLLIQLATVFSTGLFVLEPTDLVQRNVPITVATAFDGSDFVLNNETSNINADPAILYYGTATQGLTPLNGLDPARGLVVPDFIVASTHSNVVNGTNYTAIVPGVQSSLDCEYLPYVTNGTRTGLPWFSILASFYVTNITTPSCNLTEVIVAEGPDHNIYHQPNATQAYMGYFGDYMCDPDVNWSYQSERLPQPSNTTFEHRVVMSMADLRFSKYSAAASNPDLFYIEKLTIAVCKPSYSIGNYKVSYTNDVDGHTKSMTANLESNTSAEIPGFSAELLGAAVQESTNQANIGTGGQDWVLSRQVDTFYQILSAMNGKVSIGLFMDHEKLISSGTRAFNGIASQLIHDFMMKPSNTTAVGSQTYQENRLWVRELSVGFMATAFLLLAGISAALISLRPFNVVPSDPGSIGSTALILAESSYLRSLLSGLGASRATDIRQRLLSYDFRSTLSAGLHSIFAVEPVRHGKPVGDYNGHDDNTAPNVNQWWIPSAVKWWFQSLAGILTLIVIAVLEIVQQLSNNHQGFVDVSPHGFNTTHALATYIPAVVAFTISSMFVSMQLAVCILVPWLALHRGSATASRSLFLNLTQRLSPHRMWLAIKDGNMGTILILVATFLSAWLPIIVSGLYTTITVSTSQPITATQSDVFDYKQNNLFYSDNLAGPIAGLLVQNGLAYPKWTYHDLVFNELDVSNLSNLTDSIPSGTEVPFAAQMRATRPTLSCTVIPQDSFSHKWDPNPASFSNEVPEDRAALNMTAVVPWLCDGQIPNAKRFRSSWKQGFALPKNGSEIYFGETSIMSWTNESVNGNRPFDTNPNHPGATSLSPDFAANFVGGYGCPSFAVTVGRGSAVSHYNKKKNSTSYTFDVETSSIMCSQYLEVVETNVTFTIPSLGVISPDVPPVTDESTAQYLMNILPNYEGEVFEFPLNEMVLTLAFGTGNVTFQNPDGSPAIQDQLDNFVNLLATMNASMPMDSLIGDDNTQNLIDATTRLYKYYMPQAISNNMRNTNLDDAVSTPTSSAGRATTVQVETQVDVPGRLRLQQQAAPKLALQILLAVMVLCAIVSRVLLRDIQQIVPHNPCSIAGRAALFADGDVSTRKLVPLGAEWQSERQLRASGVYEGWLFSLGWWESFGVYKYGVDVGWIDGNKGEDRELKHA